MIACAAIATALLTGNVTTGPITCPERVIIRNIPARHTATVLDATGATFLEGITIAASNGLHVEGGTYGTLERDTRERWAVQISGGADISMNGPTVLGGPATLGVTGAFLTGDRGGLQVRGATRVTIRAGKFRRFRTQLTFDGATDSLAHGNDFGEASSDGLNIIGSHRIVASENYCHWYVRLGNAHPDCIQGWSLRTGPVMTQIYLINNNAEGNMQANLFGNIGGGSVDGFFAYGNRAWVMFSHTISCGGCINSVVKYNILASYPGTLFGIGKIKGLEHASNVVADNPMVDGTKEPPPSIRWNGVIPFAVGSRFEVQP